MSTEVVGEKTQVTIDSVPENTATVVERQMPPEATVAPPRQSYVPSVEEIGRWPRSDDQVVIPEPLRQRVSRYGKQATVGAVMTYVALTGAEAWLEYGLGTHISAAGFETTTHPRFGWSHSEVNFGATGRAEGDPHLHFPGMNFGLKVSTDGSNFNLGSPTTRAAVSQILSHPDPEIDKAKRAYLLSFPDHGLKGFAGVLAVELFAYSRWQRRRRNFIGADNLNEEQRKDIESGTRMRIGAAALVLATSVGYNVYLYAIPHDPTIVADPSLDGTPAQGWELKGSTPGLIQVFQEGKSTEKFDELTESNLKKLLATRPDFQAKDGWTTMVRADDFQDVAGMARQEGVISKEIGADAQAVTGDEADEKGNASYEDDELRFESDYIDTFLELGNHDNTQTIQSAKLSGVNVGDYTVRNINGIPMLFLPSIDVSVANSDAIGSILRDPNLDEAAATQKAVDVMCKDHVEQLYGHDNSWLKKVAIAAIMRAKQDKNPGCVPRLVVDGRTFTPIPIHTISVSHHPQTTVEDPLLSSGGHNTTAISTGPITIDSPIEIIRENNTTHEIQEVIIMFHPDGTVTAPMTMKTIVPPGSPDSALGSPRKHVVALNLDKNRVVVRK